MSPELLRPSAFMQRAPSKEGVGRKKGCNGTKGESFAATILSPAQTYGTGSTYAYADNMQ